MPIAAYGFTLIFSPYYADTPPSSLIIAAAIDYADYGQLV